MPFNMKLYHAGATRGDAAGIGLSTVIAVAAIEQALSKLAAATGVDISAEIGEIRRMTAALDERYAELTGWTSEP
jgi:lipid-binding SYLF domain-containing protein